MKDFIMDNLFPTSRRQDLNFHQNSNLTGAYNFMIDQGDLPRPTEPAQTPEQIAKSDADLSTFSSLSAYASSINSTLEITGGYAVEAHFGGVMTRPHGDMDAVLWLEDPNSESSAQDTAEALLRQEKTKWGDRLNEKGREHFMELREDAPALTFEERRRIELYTFDKTRARPHVKKVLIDSHGQKHEATVTTLDEIVADKVRIFNRTEEEKATKRATNQTDIDDFNRLINHPEFSKEKYLETMAGYLVYKSGGKLHQKDALILAQEQWQKAIQITSSQSL